jgi:Xaa-Pro aminopeptidase
MFYSEIIMLRTLYFIFFAITLSVNNAATANNDALNSIFTMQDRADFVDNITRQRVEKLLPRLMAETDIDMWVLISREYNEDPILKTFIPATWLSARRTTILVFTNDESNSVNAYAIAPYNIGSIFEKAWDKGKIPDQWQALLSLIEQENPKNIAINESSIWAHADGLVVTDKEKLVNVLPSKYKQRLISSEPLAVAWLEQRIPDEIEMYDDIVAIAHNIIAEGFSADVINVGETTTNDLVWWFRERIRGLKLQAWFHPTNSGHLEDSANEDNVIREGDLLHVDLGIVYLRLNTDTQQHAYVLKAGERSAPDELIQAFNTGNQLQDILTSNFSEGKTGNEVLKMSREMAIGQGLKPTIYTHPLGYHGHAAGTTLGMWDSQQGVPGSGDYPLHYNTVYSIELNNAV